MQTSRYGSVPPSLAVLMLLSNMSAHGIPSIEECTAVGVCAWQMMVHSQSVLSQFFQSTQHCYAVLDRAPELHGGKGCCASGFLQRGRYTTDYGSLYAPLFGLFDCSPREGGPPSAECKELFGPFRQYLFHPTQGMPLPV